MTGEPHRIPSIDQIRDVYEILWSFIHLDGYTDSPPWRQEDRFQPIFSDLADALRPVRPCIGSFRGWDHRVGRALRVIVEHFDETARHWGWEELAQPEPQRSAFIRRQRAQFREEVERPMYEAAITWQEGCVGLECPEKIDEGARRGREDGFGPSPSMTFSEAQSAFEPAWRRWQEALRLGCRYPQLTEVDKGALSGAFQLLTRALNAEGLARGWSPRLSQASAPHRKDPEESAAVPEALPSENEAAKSHAGGSKKEPPPEAFAAYQLWKMLGLNQQTVATRLQEERKIPIDQAKVSRWCAKVAKWLGEGNTLPPPESISMDPRTLERGPRRDGRR